MKRLYIPFSFLIVALLHISCGGGQVEKPIEEKDSQYNYFTDEQEVEKLEVKIDTIQNKLIKGENINEVENELTKLKQEFNNKTNKVNPEWDKDQNGGELQKKFEKAGKLLKLKKKVNKCCNEEHEEGHHHHEHGENVKDCIHHLGQELGTVSSPEEMEVLDVMVNDLEKSNEKNKDTKVQEEIQQLKKQVKRKKKKLTKGITKEKLETEEINSTSNRINKLQEKQKKAKNTQEKDKIEEQLKQEKAGLKSRLKKMRSKKNILKTERLMKQMDEPKVSSTPKTKTSTKSTSQNTSNTMSIPGSKSVFKQKKVTQPRSKSVSSKKQSKPTVPTTRKKQESTKTPKEKGSLNH